MSGWLVLGGTLVLVTFCVAGPLVVRAVSGRRSRPAAEDVVARLARRATTYRWAGVLAGVSLAALVAFAAPASWLGLGLAVAPTVFALCVLAGVLVGELTLSTPPSGVRRATLEVRSLRTYLPPTIAALTVGLGGILATLLAGAAVAGSPDELGRPGRQLAMQCTQASVPDTLDTAGSVAAGPWPGLFYGLPVGLGVLAGLILATVALRVIVTRARPGIGPAARAADDTLRRRSARTVVAASGLLVAASLAGPALVAGAAAKSVATTCDNSWLTFGGWVWTGLAAFSFVFACGCAAVLLNAPVEAQIRGVDASGRTLDHTR